jgi:hypothetical protein
VGAKVIEGLATDLRRVFPGLRGVSARNLKYMRAFAAAWPDRAVVADVLVKIPWSHNKMRPPLKAIADRASTTPIDAEQTMRRTSRRRVTAPRVRW